MICLNVSMNGYCNVQISPFKTYVIVFLSIILEFKQLVQTLSSADLGNITVTKTLKYRHPVPIKT